MKENTQAVLNAIRNPYIDIIGHPDDGRYPLDYEAVVREAKKYHTLLEINNASLNPQGFRPNTRSNDLELLKLCKAYGVPVIISSDAHFAEEVGRFPFVKELLKETAFPENLVANHRKELLFATLAEKKNRSGFYKI